MDAGATPTPPAEPGPSPPASGDEKATGGWRALGVLLALALAFASAVMIVAMADIGGTPRCDDESAVDAELAATGAQEVECFEGSQTQKVISLILGWPSGILAGLAALLALYFAVTGRRGQLLLRLTTVAIVFGALSIVIGSI